MKNIDSIIKQMTLEEKASLLSGKNFWETRDIEKYGIPSMFLADGPHGLRRQIASADHLGLNPSKKATCFPTAATLANSFDKDLIEEVGKALGQEAIDQQVHVLLGPGTNIKRNPLCGRNFEYFSEDPYLAGQSASAMIKGIQTSGISACVKHFVANNQEYRRMVIDSIIDERVLRELYLPPFEMAIKEGKSKSLMTAYNKVNGHYVNEHPHLLKDILRNEWNFKGLVVTDWGGSNSRVEGLKNSSDLEMPSTNFETNFELIEAVKNGDIEESLLDESVKRILALTFSTEEHVKANNQVDYDAHHSLAQKAAESSIVLLKNNDILPIKEHKKVAIIGDFASEPRYQGAGSSKVNPYKLEHTLELIDQYDCSFIGYEKGFKRFSNKSSKHLIKKAKDLAQKADIVLLYLGLDESKEAEGIDRTDISLRENQLTLIKELNKMNDNIVSIVSAGSVVDLAIEKESKALLHAYLSGQASAKAILNTVFGLSNPSGKLSETYPYDLEALDQIQAFDQDDQYALYKEGLYVGYRFYDHLSLAVRYPFGFGLSYTNFTYKDFTLNDKQITFTITNTGDYDGAEVAQLYISKEDSNLLREKQSLKGYEKVFLKKGESKQVTIDFDDYTFRVFDKNESKFVVEEGTYTVMIKSSLIDQKFSGNLSIEGIKISPSDHELDERYKEGKLANITDDIFIDAQEISIERQAQEKHSKVDHLTTVSKLKYAKGMTAKLFFYGISFAIWFLRLIKKPQKANTLIMGIYHQPLRSLSRMSGGIIAWDQLIGLIMMFNGHFFKGFKQYLRAGKEKKRKFKKEQERIKQTKIKQ